MRITIAQRLRPYSHTPGTCCLLPGTSLCFQIFPARIALSSLSGPYPEPLKALDLSLSGPVKNFTVQLDMEKGVINVWGHYREGYLRYTLFSAEDGKIAFLKLDRCPEKGIQLGKGKLVRNEVIDLFTENPVQQSPIKPNIRERLSLGCHKAQDWDLANRRGEMGEIFPFWHRLGLLIPNVEGHESEGTLKLLEQCKKEAKLHALPAFRNLYRAGFEGICVPRISDDQYQGLGVSLPSESFEGSPLPLLSQGASVIRSLFFQSSDKTVSILPALPPDFHSGRFINIASALGEFDLEWSKKTIRRMIFRSSVSQEVSFCFQKSVKSYRLRTSLKDKGQRRKTDAPLKLETGKVYYFDKFER